jgi:soluble lytic murein transglycosylase-like protein
MPAFGEGARAAVLAFAVLAFAGPAVAQPSRVKEKPPRPPLDIKSVMKEKPSKAARAKAKAFKPVEAAAAKPGDAAKPAEEPKGPELASASSTPLTLPPIPTPGGAQMLPDLKPSLTETSVAPPAEQKSAARMPGYMRVPLSAAQAALRAELNERIAHHAQLNGIPESLVHRVIMRESRYQPRVVSLGNYGLMQIRHATARTLGYTGTAAGLLDAETNLTYAVKYLAGAYRKANGDPDRAIGYYARGY